jgi:hypothetical protein
MDQSTTFYQALTTASFTLLGIWVAVMQTAHGGWRSDPARHATTLHITLKFFLPGVLGLVSLLGATTGGGLVWRVTFVIGGFAGFVESVRYLARDIGRPVAIRRLAGADPVLYLLVLTMALLPAGTLAVTPLQGEGLATGTVFVTGLLGVWIALSECPAAAHGETADSTAEEWRTEPWELAGFAPAPPVRTWRPPAPPSRRGSPTA